MAIKYLWVSQNVGFTAGITANVDKYCYNIPSNWLEWNGDTSRWVPSTTIPGSPDEYSTAYSTLTGSYNPQELDYARGYTHAKNPLLFGGYSGGSTSGTWSNTNPAHDPTAATGGYVKPLNFFNHLAILANPNTQPKNQDYLHVNNHYNFSYLGGGITGDIAKWCAYRDGLTVGDYSTVNTSGFRDPKAGLRLHTHNLMIQDYQSMTGSNYDAAGTPEFHTPATKLQSEIILSEVRIPRVGGYFTDGILTISTFGAGVKIIGGVFNDIVINRRFGNFTMNNGRVFGTLTEKMWDQGIDYGVELADVYGQKVVILPINKVTTYGGDFAKCTIYGGARGFEIPNWNPPGTPGYNQNANNITMSTDSPPLILGNGWNYLNVAEKVFGLTAEGDLDGLLNTEMGVLNLEATDTIAYSTVAGVLAEDEYSMVSIFQLPYTLTRSGLDGDPLQPLPYSPLTPKSAYERRQKRCAVELRNITNSGFTASPYKININDITRLTDPNTPWEVILRLPLLPWEVQFGTNAYVHIINNNGGWISASPNIPATATVSIGTINQKVFGTIAFGKNNPTFRNWILGGNTAMNSDHAANDALDQPIASGIRFLDPSGIVYGTEGLHLANIDTVYGIDAS